MLIQIPDGRFVIGVADVFSAVGDGFFDLFADFFQGLSVRAI